MRLEMYEILVLKDKTEDNPDPRPFKIKLDLYTTPHHIRPILKKAGVNIIGWSVSGETSAITYLQEK